MATFGGTVTVKAAGRRPKLAWAQGRTGVVTSRPRGRFVTVRVTLASGRTRSARLALTDLV
jgi:hypothetical protein